MPTFVTGGTGFIGRKLVEALLRNGEKIHLLCRQQSDVRGLRREGIEIFCGDVTDKKSIRAAMRGCQRVFHLAAYAHNWAPDPSVYFRANVEGFRNVAQVALDNKVEKVVFTSTSMTFGPTNGYIGTEEIPRKSQVFFTDYEKTKYLAEIEGDKFLAEGLPLVVVNPTRVFGPGKMTEGNSVTRIIELHLRGRFPTILGKGQEVGNYVYIDDVVDGHIKAMGRGEIGQRYILGGENSTLSDFFSLLSRLSGKKPPWIHVPPDLARLIAKIEESKAELLGRYPLITLGWVETFLRDWAFSNEKAVRELGCRFRGLKQGMQLTCDWLREKKLGG